MKSRLATISIALMLCLSMFFALPASPALADSWTQMNTNGFGVPSNISATAVASVGTGVTVGTRNTAKGCQVWTFNSSSNTWRKLSAADGFGDKNNTEVTAIVLNSANQPFLFGTRNTVTGCELWRYNAGNWSQIGADGFGYSGNTEISSALPDHGNYRVFLGTTNSSGCQLWKLKYQSSFTFTKMVGPGLLGNAAPGFGDANNVAASALMRGYGGNYRLFVGTRNTVTGCQIWVAAGDLSGFGKANANGFGDSDNTEVTSLTTAYSQKIFAGTENKNDGCELWTSVETGGPPFSDWAQAPGFTNGFGNVNNTAVSSASHMNLTNTSSDLCFGTYNDSTGCEIWLYSNSTWSKIGNHGFGSASNFSANFIYMFKSTNPVRRIVVGTGSGLSGGAKVWNNFGSGPPPPQNPVTWYLAEGTSAWGFTTYISIENPNTTATTATITYQTSDGPVPGGTVNLPAQSQTTVNPETVVPNQDFSTEVVSDQGKSIAVDRTMSWTGQGAPSPEGHSSIGVTAPAKIWFMPEGASAWGFECWLLIQNPGNTDATCNVTYMIEGETPQTITKAVPANSRASYSMKDDIGEKNSSIKVESNVPVIAERSMYRNSRREGHESIGTTTPAPDYYLAEGTTAWGFTTWVLVQNPNASAANVTITYMTSGGPQVQPSFQMAANSRKTIRVNDTLPLVDFSTKVHADVPIIAERSMFWGDPTPSTEVCHDSIGTPGAHISYYLPDGQTSEGRETFTLVQNPNSTAVQVEISYLTPSGSGNATFQAQIPANSRSTFSMADKLPNSRAAIKVVSKTAGKKIIVERAMYWNNRGAGTETMGAYFD